MINTQELTQKEEIEAFKARIFTTFGVTVHVLAEEPVNFKIKLKTLHICTLKALKANEPCYSGVKSLGYRNRRRAYLVYVQTMSYIAFKEGHTKSAIGNEIDRDHATIINSIRQIENAFFTSDFIVIDAFNNIINEIRAYVGTLPENIKKQINAQSGVPPIWNEKKNYRAI